MEQNLETIFFDAMGDEKGLLTAIENNRQVPFEIKRCYYIYRTRTNVVRGLHAHLKLKQLLICVSGSVDIYCEFSDHKVTYHLDSPNKGLLIEGLVWHKMFNFSTNAVLLVLADDFYDESDYVRNYEEFLKLNSKL